MSSTRDLRGVSVSTLNGQGSVTLIDYMGSDADIVQAARVSYGREDEVTMGSKEEKLIRYLMRHRHTSPFEMVELKFMIYAPMDLWRQWVRHRTASINEYSTRYSEALNTAQITLQDMWRIQSTNNKQGSSGENLNINDGAYLTRREKELHQHAREVYVERLGMGVAREQARKDLPLSTFTKAFWKIDLHNLLHFLKLRMDSHAQKEIREYATVIGERFVSRLFPITWQAFLDYQLDAVTLSRMEVDLLRELLHSKNDRVVTYPTDMTEREKKEFNNIFQISEAIRV